MPALSPGPVPRAWLTVLRLAFAARPGLAIGGLTALLRGKRVRGWNALCLAAVAHHGCHRAWIAAAEPALLPPPVEPVPGLVGAILLGGDSPATRASLCAAFGPDVPIFEGVAPLPTTGRPRWLLPIRAGDQVSPRLGAVLAAHLLDCDAALVYWDEDRLVDGQRDAPWIKPDWDPLLFGAQDGLIGSCVVRAGSVPHEAVEDWPAHAREIAGGDTPPLHVALILTHRSRPRAVSARPRAAAPPVAISVVVPTRDRAELLETCLAGLSRTRFPGEREIIVVDNDSREPRTHALFERLTGSGEARIVSHPGAFNFAALANAGVAEASGHLICLLNNDIEIGAPDWLEPLAALAVRDDVGAVGARLLYPDGAIQHAGVALGIGGAAGHVEKGAMPEPGVFAPWHDETRTVSAVTGACLLVDRAKYLAVGGMDQDAFGVDFNDVDLCLRLAGRGWRSVYCAEATLIHHESRSRGAQRHGAALVRFERELATLRAGWGTETVIDPHYSPLFRRQSERCLLAF